MLSLSRANAVPGVTGLPLRLHGFFPIHAFPVSLFEKSLQLDAECLPLFKITGACLGLPVEVRLTVLVNLL